MIDTHCHLDASRFDPDRDSVVTRAWAAGLHGILIPAVGPDTWEPLLALPRKDARIQVGLGIHPQFLPDLPPEDDGAHLERLDALLSQGGAVAVGECGLDGPSLPGAPLERQLAVLRGHLALARKHGLPVLMHCHRLHPALMEFLKTEAWPEAGILMHSYSGGAELARFYIQKGCHFSFAGPVTWAEARKPLDALRVIPADRLVAETDSPDQAPTPFRGQRSEPGYLPHILAGMAQVLGEPVEALAQRTTENARRLFREAFPSPSR
ncbi:TatD family deoxyribonuclease [Corallococcus sp. CA054B]|uniref:TatD family hydrolase n=1 Tax=Corallococcus sp. CA054B TaxID=2316734 RepID=UPI000EA26AED|nr:TatD family hydrolase [Corallococcus sp. CA054B]RKG63962.1 TatD family deoxyribonuclease [Corallococcus sp. CA054B]